HTRSKRDWSSDVCSSDLGVNVDAVKVTCGDPTNTSNGAKFDAVTNTSQSVTHVYSSAKTFTAKIIAERGTAPPAEMRATVTALLPAPSLFSPPGGATGVSTTVTFSWSTVMGATSYRIMVATSPAALPTSPDATACSACVINATPTTTSYTPAVGVLNVNATHYWQVKSQNTAQ